ncbi:MAG: ATP-binding protein, partial [bacterium]
MEILDLFKRNDDFLVLPIKDKGKKGKIDIKIIANHNTMKILGYHKKKFMNIYFEDLIFPDDQAKFRYFINSLLKGETNFTNIELRLKPKNNDYVWMNLNYLRRKESQYSYYILSYNSKKIFENIIKEQREELIYSQEELEFNKLKNKFFINISHEFNTPLNLIFSSLDLLDLFLNKKITLEEEKEKLKMPLNTIRQNANRLSRLVQNLIDITKMNADDYHLSMEVCDIVSLLSRIYKSVKKHMKGKNRKFIFNKNIKHKDIKCDPINIERIILNLLSNSIKFSKEGDQISLNLYENKDNIFISVKDTGIGIAKDKREFIFKPFRQVDETLSRSAEGSGIGLSISKCLIEMHGGEIIVKSERG